MRPHLNLTGAVAACALGLSACGGGDDSPGSEARAGDAARPGARPVLCADLRMRETGTIETPEATELSGLAISRSQRGVLWTHNDSGDVARLFAVNTRGRLLSEVAVSGAAATDWEDVAAGRGAVYVADIGDNGAQRPEVVVYRVPEPRVKGAPALTVDARSLVLRYPDGAHDAEALLVSPSNGALLVVTKDFSGRAGVYAARQRGTGVRTLRRVARIALGGGEAVTAGDISADGRIIAVRTYFRAYVWKRKRGETIAEAMRRKPCAAAADLFDEGQGEALALTRNGGAFYTVPEGGRPPIRRYSPR
ncbi:MAG: hypothetical protein JW895_08365 [Thermoleophilaceae bacterium]|nr:hypothetical protein [Thermoleophilaceae bacterium]